MKLSKPVLFIIITCILLFASGVRADELDVLNSFYGGLADIIEQNRKNPDLCVKKAQAFIHKNAKSLNDAAASAQEKAESQAEPSDDDVARMMNQPPLQAMDQQMGAIQRFQLVYGIFAQKHPEQAAKIQQTMAEYEQR